MPPPLLYPLLLGAIRAAPWLQKGTMGLYRMMLEDPLIADDIAGGVAGAGAAKYAGRTIRGAKELFGDSAAGSDLRKTLIMEQARLDAAEKHYGKVFDDLKRNEQIAKASRDFRRTELQAAKKAKRAGPDTDRKQAALDEAEQDYFDAKQARELIHHSVRSSLQKGRTPIVQHRLPDEIIEKYKSMVRGARRRASETGGQAGWQPDAVPDPKKIKSMEDFKQAKLSFMNAADRWPGEVGPIADELATGYEGKTFREFPLLHRGTGSSEEINMLDKIWNTPGRTFSPGRPYFTSIDPEVARVFARPGGNLHKSSSDMGEWRNVWLDILSKEGRPWRAGAYGIGSESEFALHPDAKIQLLDRILDPEIIVNTRGLPKTQDVDAYYLAKLLGLVPAAMLASQTARENLRKPQD